MCVFISNIMASNNGLMDLVGIPFEMQLAHNVFVKFHGYGQHSSQNTHGLATISTQISYILLHTWHFQHFETRWLILLPSFIALTIHIFWKFAIGNKVVHIDLFSTIPKCFNIISMYLHWLKYITWSCAMQFTCIPKGC